MRIRGNPVKKAIVFAGGSSLIALLATLSTGCYQDEVKMVDVPRKDIAKEILNKPIPPEAFKTMAPGARKQMKNMEEAVKKASPDQKVNPEP
jgi:hypothetical protein